MKSERRHELEHNALADWMTNLVETLKPYSNHIMAGVLVVALAFLAYTMWNRSVTSEKAVAWDEMLAAMTGGKPSDLELTADAYPDTQVGFFSRTLAGDLRLADGCRLVFESKSQANQELEKAIDNYQLVVGKCKIPGIAERAQFGLGRAYETQGDLKKAAEAYAAVSKNYPEGIYANLARERFDDLERPDTKDFYGRFAIYKPKAEGSSVKDEPGTPGERPSFSLDDLRELGGPSKAADKPLFTPQMKIDGQTIKDESSKEKATPEKSAEPEKDAAPKSGDDAKPEAAKKEAAK